MAIDMAKVSLAQLFAKTAVESFDRIAFVIDNAALLPCA